MTENAPSRAEVPYSAGDFAREAGVSRETFQRLKRYGALLEEWQERFNLVGPKTIPEMWHRHFLDSFQLMKFVNKDAPVWLDFGSGAGFPGLVVAILLQEKGGGGTVHLVESIGKKCRFLREVAKDVINPESGVEVIVHQDRLENLKPFQCDFVSARAVTSLNNLCQYAHPFCGLETACLFPKGQDVDRELTEASKYWNIDLDKYPSITDPRGSILLLSNLSPKDKKSGRKRNGSKASKSRKR